MVKATYRAGLFRFAVFVVCWTIVLLTAGALVTSEDAALAVPDWPLSYGSLTPPMVGGIAFEHTHRVLAAILGMFIVVLAVWLWAKDERRWMKYLGLAAVAGVIFQGVLGGLTVLELLKYWLPVMHAVTAEIMFAVLVSIAVFTSRWWLGETATYEDSGSGFGSIHTIVTLNSVLIFVQVLLGAGFRHRYISLLPHVIGSVCVLGMVIYTAIVLRRRFSAAPEMVKARKLLHAIVGTQFLLGLIAYYARVTTANAPEPVAFMVGSTVVHTVVGAVLFATSIYVVILSYRLVPRNGEVRVAAEGRMAARG
jgi:heme a synthase